MASNEMKPRVNSGQRQAQARPLDFMKRQQRPVHRSVCRADVQARTTTKEIIHPPSPPISSNLSRKVHHNSPSRPKLKSIGSSQQRQESEIYRSFECKRKRSRDAESLNIEDQDNVVNKRAKVASLSSCVKNKERIKSTSKNGLSIDNWSKTGYWFSQNPDSDPVMSQTMNRKRSSSSISYTQSVKEGLSPLQYSPGYEKVLENAGIFMLEEQRQDISSTSQELCEVLLTSFFPPPSNSLFAGHLFHLTVNQSRSENEPRVQRDITPLLVPCASLLYLHDRIQQCRHLSAKIQCAWTRVAPLAGPLPIPDYVVGFQDSAFTKDEISKLQMYSASGKPTMFKDGLYFPFLIAEVKCGEVGLSVAQRQSMHVASVAANAIIQLYRDQAVSRLKELDRQILVFSVSHDHMHVAIHGHYARVEDGDKVTFHRYELRSFVISDRDGKERWTAYHIVRKIYDYFAPIHLQRIRDAIEQLSTGLSFELSSASLESSCGVDQDDVESGSQEVSEVMSSSRGGDSAKKAKLKTKVMLQEENDANRERNKELKEQIQSVMKQLQEAKEEKRKLFELLEKKYG